MARAFIAEHSDDPGDPESWEYAAWLLTDHLAPDAEDVAPMQGAPPDYVAEIRLRVSRLLEDRGMIVDEGSRERLLAQVFWDYRAAFSAIAGRARGDYREPAWLAARPAAPPAAPPNFEGPPGSSVTFETLLGLWELDAIRDPVTARNFRRKLSDFASHIGHDDPRGVSRADVSGWKEALLSGDAPLSRKTVFDKIAALATILNVGLRHGHLTDNPATGLAGRKKDRPPSPVRGFTDEEAQTVLLAARKEQGFLRWAPWLCAYSGARVGEVGQLRRSDVDLVGDIWCLKISGEAGSVKSGAAERTIPIHPAIISEGFLAYVNEVTGERLFPEVHPDKDGRYNTPASRRVSRWFRERLGFKDLSLKPDHSWRHRFITQCRSAGLDPEARHRIVGHTNRHVSEQYGVHEVRVLLRELEKVRALPLDGGSA